jgi:hypothetical protein
MQVSERLPVEIAGNGGLLKIGTMPEFEIRPGVDSGDFFGVHLRFRRRAGRIIGILCQCVGDARKLPGFEPATDPSTE